MSQLSERTGTYGIWTASFQWPEDPGAVADAAAELEDLGFGTLWLGMSAGDLKLHETILSATTRLVVASGIVNVWTEPAGTVAESTERLRTVFPGRFVLGLGAGHAKFVEPATGEKYRQPLSRVASYLDELDAATRPVPAADRVLAALGPKALALAAERSAGAHPYLITAEHTADARAALGPDRWLGPEQKVVVETDPTAARDAARSSVGFYLDLPNYVNNLYRLGFDESDVSDGGSDRLLDRLVAWGDDATVASRVRDHLEAGADHVALQVLPTGSDGAPGLPLAEWRAAAALFIN